MEGTARPEYGKVVDICTRDSLRELATPVCSPPLMPIVVGFGLGVGALAGFLGGAIAPVPSMAVFLANPVAPGTTPRSSSRMACTAARLTRPRRDGHR